MSKKAALSNVKVPDFGSGGAGGVDHIVSTNESVRRYSNRVPQTRRARGHQPEPDRRCDRRHRRLSSKDTPGKLDGGAYDAAS
ncbi:hypothetical protein MRX96_032419 [Rhipicephalus microplus]